jgi:hypothetical protein
MNEARPFASLSSGLLARKGAAKPAMRPQGFGQFGSGLDDLGWNDMGDEPADQDALPEHVPSSIAALTPAPRYEAEPPAVHGQRRALAESFSADEDEAADEAPEVAFAEAPEPLAEVAVPAPKPVKAAEPAKAEPAEIVAIPRRTKAMPAREKSAFTLRLDPDRHFRLRLACAVTGSSAQQIVTGALDELLRSIPEIDALAGQMPAKARARR